MVFFEVAYKRKITSEFSKRLINHNQSFSEFSKTQHDNQVQSIPIMAQVELGHYFGVFNDMHVFWLRWLTLTAP